MLLYKQKKNQGPKGNRLLISITVLGSAGPIRFVVNEEELVAAVIDIALKSYAREGRLPVLGSDLNDFLLYCPSAGSDALSPWETIGAQGARNFMLCKKPRTEKMEEDGRSTEAITRKGSGNWKMKLCGVGMKDSKKWDPTMPNTFVSNDLQPLGSHLKG